MTQLDHDATFDIFRHHERGPIWVQSIRGRDEAIRLVAKLSAEHPAETFRVWDPRKGRFMDLPASGSNLGSGQNK